MLALRNGVALDNPVGAVLSRKNHHGHSAAWVSTAAGEVEVLIFGGSLGSFKPVVPIPVGHDTVNRAAVGAIHPFDIDWSKKVFDNDAFSQPFDATAFHFVETPLLECDVVVVGDS